MAASTSADSQASSFSDFQGTFSDFQGTFSDFQGTFSDFQGTFGDFQGKNASQASNLLIINHVSEEFSDWFTYPKHNLRSKLSA
jgi:hypothetical protein